MYNVYHNQKHELYRRERKYRKKRLQTNIIIMLYKIKKKLRQNSKHVTSNLKGKETNHSCWVVIRKKTVCFVCMWI